MRQIPALPALARQDGRLVAPDEAEWAALSPAEREMAEHELIADMVEAEDEAVAALTEADVEAMAEGDTHDDLRGEAKRVLRRHFHNERRSIYVGSVSVFYPGRRGFVPDLVAVLDVSPHQRSSWMV